MGYANLKKKNNDNNDGGKPHIKVSVGDVITRSLITFVASAFVVGLAVLLCGEAYFGGMSDEQFITALIWIVVISFLITLGLMMYYVLVESQEKAAEIVASKNLREEAMQWAAKAEANGGFIPLAVDIALRADEAVFFKSFSCLYEVRAIRVTNHVGAHYRVTQRIGVGSARSVSESHDEWRPISTGTLYITNQSVLFVGDQQSRMVEIKKIVSVKNTDSIIEVVSDNRVKSMRFTVSNGLIAKVLLDHLVKTVGKPLNSLLSNAGQSMGKAVSSVRLDGIANPYENGLDNSAVKLLETIIRLSRGSQTAAVIKAKIHLPNGFEQIFCAGIIPPEVALTALVDAIKCHLLLGHTLEQLQDEDGFGLLSLIWCLVFTGGDTSRMWELTSSHEKYGIAVRGAKMICDLLKPLTTMDNNLPLAGAIRGNESKDVYREYVERLYDWANAIAIVDEELSGQEQTCLNYLRSLVES